MTYVDPNVPQTNLQRLIKIYLEQIQESEDAIYDLLTKSGVGARLADISGAQLDIYGRNLGELRNAATDEVYRLLILARINSNTSQGTVEDLIRVINSYTLALLGTASNPIIEQVYPATIIVQGGYLGGNQNGIYIGEALGRSTSAGISSFYFYNPTLTPFRFMTTVYTGTRSTNIDHGFNFGELSNVIKRK